MRSTLAILLASSLWLALPGCGGSETPDSGDESGDVTATATEGGGGGASDSQSEDSGEKGSNANAAALPADLKEYLTSDFSTILIAHPKRVLSRKELGLPLLKETVDQSPVDAGTIERIVVAGGSAPPPNNFNLLILVEFTDAEAAKAGLGFAQEAQPYEDAEMQGQKYLRATGPNPGGTVVIYQPNPQTVLLTVERQLEKVLSGKQGKSPLAASLAKTDLTQDLVAIALLEPNRELIDQTSGQVPLEGPAEQFASLPQEAKSLQLELQLAPAPRLKIIVQGQNEDSARQIAQMADSALQLGKGFWQQYKQEGLQKIKSLPADEQDAATGALNYVDRVLAAVSTKQDGDRVMLAMSGIGTLQEIMDAFAPAVEAAQAKAKQVAKLNNLKTFALAMHNYDAVHRKLPGGESKLSWRVHILPYIEMRELYEQFNLEEPWDSPTNKKLLNQMPEIFKSAAVEDPTKTCYVVPVGPKTIFGRDKPASFASIRDGSSNTLLILKVDPEKAVPWTKPDADNYDPQNPKAGLSGKLDGAIVAAFADGSVHRLSPEIDAETLKALFTADGAEAIDPDKLK